MIPFGMVLRGHFESDPQTKDGMTQMPMVTRFRIEDETGRVLTIAGFFSYDTDDAVQFTREDDAIEVSDEHLGTSVECFTRYSATADRIPHNAAARLEAAFSEAAE